MTIKEKINQLRNKLTVSAAIALSVSSNPSFAQNNQINDDSDQIKTTTIENNNNLIPFRYMEIDISNIRDPRELNVPSDIIHNYADGEQAYFNPSDGSIWVNKFILPEANIYNLAQKQYRLDLRYEQIQETIPIHSNLTADLKNLEILYSSYLQKNIKINNLDDAYQLYLQTIKVAQNDYKKQGFSRKQHKYNQKILDNIQNNPQYGIISCAFMIKSQLEHLNNKSNLKEKILHEAAHMKSYNEIFKDIYSFKTPVSFEQLICCHILDEINSYFHELSKADQQNQQKLKDKLKEFKTTKLDNYLTKYNKNEMPNYYKSSFIALMAYTPRNVQTATYEKAISPIIKQYPTVEKEINEILFSTHRGYEIIFYNDNQKKEALDDARKLGDGNLDKGIEIFRNHIIASRTKNTPLKSNANNAILYFNPENGQISASNAYHDFSKTLNQINYKNIKINN